MAIAQSAASSPRYADIGVATLGPWQGRGFATAAARIVADQIRRQGKIPVWSTGEGNVASQRVAAKAGFVKCGERLNVIPEAR